MEPPRFLEPTGSNSFLSSLLFDGDTCEVTLVVGTNVLAKFNRFAVLQMTLLSVFVLGVGTASAHLLDNLEQGNPFLFYLASLAQADPLH